MPSSCADCLEILGTSASWSPKGLSRLVMEKLLPSNSRKICPFYNTVLYVKHTETHLVLKLQLWTRSAGFVVWTTGEQ